MLRKKIIKCLPHRLIMLFFVLLLNSSYVVKGKSAGFFCDDESIKKPYSGDTVSLMSLISVLMFFFPILIKLIELRCDSTLQQVPSESLFKWHANNYYSGIMFIVLTVEILKNLVDELRPHFFYTCLPDMSQIDCSQGLITNFTCMGIGPSWLLDRDIYKSFPSGHAALSFYAFVYISVYSNQKLRFTPGSFNGLWSAAVSVIVGAFAVLCCVTRLLDNRHFWWDVLAGMAMGLAVGVLMLKYTFSIEPSVELNEKNAQKRE